MQMGMLAADAAEIGVCTATKVAKVGKDEEAAPASWDAEAWCAGDHQGH